MNLDSFISKTVEYVLITMLLIGLSYLKVQLSISKDESWL